MRKGFDGLFPLVREGLAHDPLSDDLYVARNRIMGRHGAVRLRQALKRFSRT